MKGDAEAKFLQKMSIVPGRQFFSLLSQWTKVNVGISISALQVVPYFKSYEVPAEIKNVIKSIVDGIEF